jgi:hypothetical protein
LSAKKLFDYNKTKAVFGNVLLAFSFVPLKFHIASIDVLSRHSNIRSKLESIVTQSFAVAKLLLREIFLENLLLAQQKQYATERHPRAGQDTVNFFTSGATAGDGIGKDPQIAKSRAVTTYHSSAGKNQSLAVAPHMVP